MSYERFGAWTVDHAMRVLATGCAEQHRPVPAAGGVVLGPASVLVRLTTPDEAPPVGWTVQDHGRTWLSSLHWLQTAVVDSRLPEPYPLLVSAGMTDEGRLLLNLAAADGPISIEGDPELARILVRSWSRRLTASPWAAGILVIHVGIPPGPGFGGWGVSQLTEEAFALADRGGGGILLFDDRPLGRDLHLVNRLLSEPVRRWSVVAVGADDASWRLTVGVDGRIDTGLLAAPVLLRL